MKSPKPSVLLVCVSALVVLFCAGTAAAVTRYVDPRGWPYSSYDNLSEAIEASSDGDVVIAKDGVFTGEGNRNIVCYGKAITIRSENGPEHTTIDLAGDGIMRQFMRFQHSEGHDTVLEGLTIINGCARYYPVGSGGGIYCSASPTIRNCVFIDCEANVGGAIEVFCPTYIAAPDIIDCTFIRCSGPAVCAALNAQPYIEGCTFYDNGSYALSIGDQANVDVTVEDCLFDGAHNYQAISVAGPATITNCTVARSTRGVVVSGPAADLVFQRNIVADNDGYGMDFIGTGWTATLMCNDFSGNDSGDLNGYTGPTDTNIFLDPKFCYWESNTDDFFTLRNDSPCLPDHNDCGVLMGAFGVGCSRPIPPPPSCPVLFVERDGTFHAENTLLTACEETGYRDEVVDYYRLPDDISLRDGKLALQLREMEDEISYIRDLELIEVRHRAGTRVECSVDGAIVVYGEDVAPVSAYDQNGADRLADVVAEDGEVFSSRESGHLILEFPYPEGSVCTITTARGPKSPEDRIECGALPVHHRSIVSDDGKYPIRLGFEVLEPDGTWSDQVSAPVREWPHDEAFTRVLPEVVGETYTVRLSWEGSYETDAVLAAGSPVEPLGIETHRVSSHELERGSGLSPIWFGFDGSESLVLRNGDVLGFEFAVSGEAGAHETTYVLMAEGRYEPDYDVYNELKPAAFALHGNYPNPFSRATETKIQYDLPSSAHVRIDVYDAAGRKVTTLVDAAQTAGRKSVVWKGIDERGNLVASGVYFCRMNAGGVEKNIKMMLMK